MPLDVDTNRLPVRYEFRRALNQPLIIKFGHVPATERRLRAEEQESTTVVTCEEGQR